MLRDLAASCGCECDIGIPEFRVDFLLWDVDPWSGRTAEHIQEFKARQPDARVIAVAAFAHPEDSATFEAAGVDEVVDKLHASSLLPELLARP